MTTLKNWWKRMWCQHASGLIVEEITWDGETMARCKQCGKLMRIPLRG